MDKVRGDWPFRRCVGVVDVEEISLELEFHDRSFLHLLAKPRDGSEWALTVACAHPNPSIRMFLWGKLSEVVVIRPWALIGNFNYVLLDEERSSNSGTASRFQSWAEDSGLIDVGFIGNRFAWSHGLSVESRKAARLDRALCCDIWRRLFPSAVVRHLGHSHSDHCPLLMDLTGPKKKVLGKGHLNSRQRGCNIENLHVG